MKTARRLFPLSLAIITISSIVLSAVAPLLTPPISVAQTNPQTTDIFTGQFIPAYLGAAYDPSEAYKQMAGATVYVFAYDTWGNVVNDFAYKTQVKADGSFQAAGLPNASHYGVYFPDRSDGVHPFRSPRDDDQIRSAFAYQQATFPNDTTPPHTQINNQRIDGSNGTTDIRGKQVFVTSSRQVSIDNHHNIFPLVPLNVLSVFIADDESIEHRNDVGMINSPYEIYAQRVAIDRTPEASESDPQPIALSSTANGPVIRGRTINFTKTDDSNLEKGTIFQAYAPKGVYAITYWRPSGIDATNQMTYLTYDGKTSLDTPVNGLAIEHVGRFDTEDNWKDLIESPSTWAAYPGSTNVWGMITSGVTVTQGPSPNISKPHQGAVVTINDSRLKPMNLLTRRCGDSPSFTTGSNGLYFFTNACSGPQAGEIQNRRYQTTMSVRDTSDKNLSSIENFPVTIGGSQGPTSQYHNLGAKPSEAITSRIILTGRPYRAVTAQLILDNKVVANLRRPDENGYVYVPKSYIGNNPYAGYKIRITPEFPEVVGAEKLEFALDSIPTDFNSGLLVFEDMVLDQETDTFTAALKNFTIDKILSAFKIKPAFAALPNYDMGGGAAGGLPVPLTSGGGVNYWKVYLDARNLDNLKDGLTSATWSIEKLELVPEEVQPNGLYMGFYANARPCALGTEEEQGNFHGYLRSGDNDSSGSAGPADSSIIGFRLVCREDRHNGTEGLNNLFDATGLDSLSFRLKVELRNNGDIDQTADNDILPRYLKTDSFGAPIVISKTNGGQYAYQSNINTVTLYPETPQCDGGGIDLNPVGGMSFDIGRAIKGATCTAVMAVIDGISWVMSYIADQFVTIDPINGSNFSGLTLNFWNIIRNFVNALTVFILIVAGVAIMLRYEPTTFKLQSILTKLIITIVAVNFSILVLQFAIDATNVLAYSGYHYLIGSLTTGDEVTAAGLSAAVVGYIVSALIFAAGSGIGGWLAIVGGFAAIGLLIIYVGIKIMVQYYFRLIVLLICVVIAPAAIAATILPKTRSYFNKWKDMFVGALVAQIALGFVLAITFAALNNFTSAPSLRSALFQLILAFALFYMATIIPAKAAAMAGVDMARGIESLAKKGALMAGGRAKNLGISYLKNRELTKAREIALQDEIAKATAGKSGISRVMAKRGVINADKRERFADKYLQRGILLGQTKDDMDKLTEEAYDQALDERRARLRRHNEEEYDYQDEREYKKKLDEQTQDAYRRQQQLGNRAAYDFADEKERQRGFKNVDAEIQDRLIRLQKPDVFEELEDEEREKQLLSYDQAWGKVDGRRGLGSDAGRDISEIRKARDTYLTYRGQSFIGSQAFNETVKEYLKYERMSDDEKLIVNNMLTQMDGAKTVDEYSQKHQNFTYKDATGQKAWMEFWKDVGAPNGFVSASRAGSATDQMMLSIVPQLMAEKNPEYYRDLAVDLNKAAKSAKRSGQFTMEFTDIPRAAGLSTPANLPEGANGPLVHKLVTEHNDLAGRAHLTPDQQNRLNRLRNALGRYGYRP